MAGSKRTTEILALGMRVREARCALRMTQEELSVRSGLSRACVSRTEEGEHGPSYDTLRGLALALGVSADYLLGIAPNCAQSGTPSPSPAIVNLLRRLRAQLKDISAQSSDWAEIIGALDAALPAKDE